PRFVARQEGEPVGLVTCATDVPDRARRRPRPARGAGRRYLADRARGGEMTMADWRGAGGRRVIITGATNGIGLAAAEALVARGAELTIVARSEARATAAVARIGSAGGPGTNVDVLLADLASQASVRRLAGEILARYPRVD